MRLHSQQSNHCRRLIVDTDLGLDDLVALAILRLQQCLLNFRPLEVQHQKAHCQKGSSLDGSKRWTPFRLSGVTITSGVSCANAKNAALLRRILPPGTSVYVGRTDTSLSWNDDNDAGKNGHTKPSWWTRTAQRVEEFLSSLPPPPAASEGPTENRVKDNITAQEFLADSMNDPNVDILCLAPLSTVASALQIFESHYPQQTPEAKFFIMGGIRYDSRWTERAESTAPFGYRDIVGNIENGVDASSSTKTETTDGTNQQSSAAAETQIENPLANNNNLSQDQFGEFNFALDITAARNILSSISAHIIPLEACTLVPKHMYASDITDCSSSGLLPLLSSLSDEYKLGDDNALRSNGLAPNNNVATDIISELNIARNILFELLQQYGTNETQWDSISAAIYCNIFDSFCFSESRKNVNDDVVDLSCVNSEVGFNSTDRLKNSVEVMDVDQSRSIVPIDSRNFTLSELGAMSFPGCNIHKKSHDIIEHRHTNCENEIESGGRRFHLIHPAFSVDDECKWFRHLSFLLHNGLLKNHDKI